MTRPILLDNQRFGRLLVITRAPNNKHNQTRWLCRCDCGNEVVVTGGGLRIGDTRSCGCLHREVMKTASKTHGYSNRGCREYRAWQSAKRRCDYKKYPLYKNHGGRGIKVCDEWLHDFAAFLRDMGPCPPGLTLERVDNNGNYEPGNCKWASMAEQNQNRRDTRFVEYQGQTVTLNQLARISGVSKCALRNRIVEMQMTPEEAVSAIYRNGCKLRKPE